jgi:hypothetical protein
VNRQEVLDEALLLDRTASGTVRLRLDLATHFGAKLLPLLADSLVRTLWTVWKLWRKLWRLRTVWEGRRLLQVLPVIVRVPVVFAHVLRTTRTDENWKNWDWSISISISTFQFQH